MRGHATRTRMQTLGRRTRHGLLFATAHLTATEGPLRLALDELDRRGVGTRVVKGALAATSAWLVASIFTPSTLPFVASLTALFSVQATIAASVTAGRQRVLGVVVGIAVAFAVAEFLGIHSWTVGLVVLAAFLVGLRLKLEGPSVEQVAATAILVMFVQSTTDARLIYSYSYLIDVAVGTGIGLLLNAVVAPPSYVPSARAAVRATGERLGHVLEDLASELSAGLELDEAEDFAVAARTVASERDDVAEALEKADESLRFNVSGAGQREALRRCRAVTWSLAPALEETVSLTRAIRQTMEQPDGHRLLAPERLGQPLADLLSGLIALLMEQVDAVDGVEANIETPASPLLLEARQLVEAVLDATMTGLPDAPAESRWRVSGVVGAAVGLASALTDPEPEPEGEWAPGDER